MSIRLPNRDRWRERLENMNMQDLLENDIFEAGFWESLLKEADEEDEEFSEKKDMRFVHEGLLTKLFRSIMGTNAEIWGIISLPKEALKEKLRKEGIGSKEYKKLKKYAKRYDELVEKNQDEVPLGLRLMGENGKVTDSFIMPAIHSIKESDSERVKGAFTKQLFKNLVLIKERYKLRK